MPPPPHPPQLFRFFISKHTCSFCLFALLVCFPFLFFESVRLWSWHASKRRKATIRLAGGIYAAVSRALLQKTALISLTLWPPHDSLVKEGEWKGGGNKKKWEKKKRKFAKNFCRLLHEYAFRYIGRRRYIPEECKVCVGRSRAWAVIGWLNRLHCWKVCCLTVCHDLVWLLEQTMACLDMRSPCQWRSSSGRPVIKENDYVPCSLHQPVCKSGLVNRNTTKSAWWYSFCLHVSFTFCHHHHYRDSISSFT